MKPSIPACAALLTLAGCLNPFAPALENAPGESASVIGDQHTIDGALQKFRQSYAFRDSTLYGEVLAGDFIFLYRDYDQGVDVYWGRDDDMRTTYGLFQNTERLDLVWNNTTAESGDSLRMNITKGFNLTVTFNPSDIIRIDGYANLTFTRRSQDDIWMLTRWNDQSNF